MSSPNFNLDILSSSKYKIPLLAVINRSLSLSLNMPTSFEFISFGELENNVTSPFIILYIPLFIFTK